MRRIPLLVVLFSSAASVAAPQSYTFEDLGAPRTDLLDLRGLINNRATIAVTGELPAAAIPEPSQPQYNPEPDRGWAYRNGTYTRIPRPGGTDLPGDRLMALNDLDEMVGYFFTSYDAYSNFWYHARSGEQRTLRSFETNPRPTLGIGMSNGLTNSGIVLGARINDFEEATLLNLRTGVVTALLQDLGLEYPVAYAINNRGWVPVVDDALHLYQAGTGKLIPTNFVGEVISDSNVQAAASSTTLSLWRNGQITRVQLPGAAAEGYPYVAAKIAINDWGHVVGSYHRGSALSAFLYDGKEVRDLNDLVPASERGGWTLYRATGINDLGQIVGAMRNSAGQRRLFLLTPSETALSGGHWDALEFPTQTGTFTLVYDAVPMAENLDGVTGLSLTDADAYTDLAAIVRFNTNGRVDARNGNYYRAVNTLNYVSGLVYRIELTVNLSTRRYSAKVTPAGGDPVVIAKDYAFRSEMSKATHLDTLNTFSSGGAVALGNLKVVPDSLAPITSTGGRWASAGVGSQAGTVTLRFQVVPAAKPIDGVVGLSRGTADDINDLATTLRFNTGGRVDARNGSRYGSVRSFKYVAGNTYDVVMTVNVATRRYSATIASPGQSPVVIANNYAFRGSQAAVTLLDRLNVRSSGGQLTVQQIRVN